MNLNEYYRNHKDAINSSIMEIACDLAVGQLLNAHDAPFETFVEADDPDDPDSGTHYKEEFQKGIRHVLRRGVRPCHQS